MLYSTSKGFCTLGTSYLLLSALLLLLAPSGYCFFRCHCCCTGECQQWSMEKSWMNLCCQNHTTNKTCYDHCQLVSYALIMTTDPLRDDVICTLNTPHSHLGMVIWGVEQCIADPGVLTSITHTFHIWQCAMGLLLVQGLLVNIGSSYAVQLFLCAFHRDVGYVQRFLTRKRRK